MNKILTFLFIMLLASEVFAAASNVGEIKLDNDAPINIKSNSLAVLNEKKCAFFKGNVVVTQKDVTIKSDEMHVFSYFDQKTQKNTFKRIECYGNVKFNSKDKKANSQKAIYYVTEGLLELTKDVYLKEGGNTIQGEKFIYEVKTGKTSISNNPASTAKTPEEKLTENVNELKKGLLVGGSPAGRVRATLIPGGGIEKIEMPTPPPSLRKNLKKRKISSN